MRRERRGPWSRKLLLELAFVALAALALLLGLPPTATPTSPTTAPAIPARAGTRAALAPSAERPTAAALRTTAPDR